MGRGLLGVGARSHVQVCVRARQGQVPEEGVRHLGVVVLTGMDDDVPDRWACRKGARERRELHEVGTRPDDGENNSRQEL